MYFQKNKDNNNKKIYKNTTQSPAIQERLKEVLQAKENSTKVRREINGSVHCSKVLIWEEVYSFQVHHRRIYMVSLGSRAKSKNKQNK